MYSIVSALALPKCLTGHAPQKVAGWLFSVPRFCLIRVPVAGLGFVRLYYFFSFSPTTGVTFATTDSLRRSCSAVTQAYCTPEIIVNAAVQ
jgi:hypothetical protein